MFSPRKVFIAPVAAASFIAMSALSLPAMAAPPVDTVLNTVPYTNLKLRIYYNADASGTAFSFYSFDCTATTNDVDVSYPTLNFSPTAGNWNNQGTAWRDFNGCDVKFFTSTNYGGTPSTWQNSGNNIVQMSATFNRNVESFKVS
ncbi:MAG: hypothetical protein EPO13_03945 [Actinomycetota bacterium]|nr:MAG: hypothetical protein EPO13_03945 [Actinomycetota bacterium]